MAFDDGKKTVSGSIAHTDDAAAKVPFVSLKCGIAPTLTGKSAIECVQVNSDNLFLLPSSSFSVSGVDFNIENNSIVIDGTSTANISSKDNNYKTNFAFGLPKGTYYFTRGTWSKATYVYKLADDSTALVTNSGSFTLTEYTEIYIGFYIGTGQTVSEVTFDGYLKQGSSASSYSPQPHPTQYTANLGRTVYGGQVDIVNGEGTNENNKFTVTSDMSDSIRYIGSGNTAYIQINKTPASNGRWQDLVCSHFTPANIYAGGTQQGIGCYSSQFYIRDSRFTSKQDFLDFLTEQETLGTPLEICYKLATPTDFTFTPITPTPETVGKVNNVYCDTGDTELTYYDNAHGFAEVTVNKTGKNLISVPIFTPSTPTLCFDAGRDITVSNITMSFLATNAVVHATNAAIVDYRKEDGTHTYRTLNWFRDANNNQFTANTPQNGKFKNSNSNITFRYIYIYYESITYSQFESDCISEWQIELASTASDYTPYEAVSKTAYLHKVIYGGQADVVKGICEPKNLFDDSSFPRTATDNTYYAQFQSNLAEGNKYKIPTIHIEPDVAYVLSFDVECNTEPFNASVGIGIGSYSRDIATVTYNTSGRISVPFTLTSALKEQYGDILSFRVPRYNTPREFTFTISNVQLEKASSASEYAPHFDPFSFPPISIGTDEGENTLFANEGDSAITYRKAVD